MKNSYTRLKLLQSKLERLHTNIVKLGNIAATESKESDCCTDLYNLYMNIKNRECGYEDYVTQYCDDIIDSMKEREPFISSWRKMLEIYYYLYGSRYFMDIYFNEHGIKSSIYNLLKCMYDEMYECIGILNQCEYWDITVKTQ